MGDEKHEDRITPAITSTVDPSISDMLVSHTLLLGWTGFQIYVAQSL
ncbi:MAG TPA: hypothetical protein VK638_34330 [Edaphobacter sp.]|nr:hypothetical protein [Edaphobacter sp.]